MTDGRTGAQLLNVSIGVFSVNFAAKKQSSNTIIANSRFSKLVTITLNQLSCFSVIVPKILLISNPNITAKIMIIQQVFLR